MTRYLKNMTNFNQQFRAAGHSFTVKPGATITMTEEEFADHTTQFLLARGIFALLEDQEGLENVVAEAEERQAKIDEARLEVNVASEDTTNVVHVVQCAATKKNGERCQNNVNVPSGEYEEAKPYFCAPHRNEDASLYELVDGAWIKREPVEETVEDVQEETEPEVVEEEPKAAEPVEEPEAEAEAEPEVPEVDVEDILAEAKALADEDE